MSVPAESLLGYTYLTHNSQGTLSSYFIGSCNVISRAESIRQCRNRNQKGKQRQEIEMRREDWKMRWT